MSFFSSSAICFVNSFRFSSATDRFDSASVSSLSISMMYSSDGICRIFSSSAEICSSVFDCSASRASAARLASGTLVLMMKSALSAVSWPSPIRFWRLMFPRRFRMSASSHASICVLRPDSDFESTSRASSASRFFRIWMDATASTVSTSSAARVLRACSSLTTNSRFRLPAQHSMSRSLIRASSSFSRLSSSLDLSLFRYSSPPLFRN